MGKNRTTVMTQKSRTNKTRSETDCSGHPFVEEVLRQELPFMLSLAWQALPRNLVHTDLYHDVVQELVQMAFVKYWWNARTKQISYPRAYLRRTMCSLVADIGRHHREGIGLPLDEYGEVSHGTVLNARSGDFADPAHQYQEKESFNECLRQVVIDVISLPPGQQCAMIAHLKDQVEDIEVLTEAFKVYGGIDIAGISWPQNKQARQSSRTLLLIAQKKMRLRKSNYLAV